MKSLQRRMFLALLLIFLGLQACGQGGALYNWCKKRDYSPRVCSKYF